MEKDVTVLLQQWRNGDKAALEVLAPMVYEELRRVAGGYLRGEREGHTLQPTALVNEVYLRLAQQDQPDYQNRAHFTAIAANCMRKILIDHARRRNAAKRGSGQRNVALEEALVLADDRSAELLALDEAMNELATFDSRRSHVLEMHYFGGMTQEEIALAMDVHYKTVANDLKLAKAWLKTWFDSRSEQ